MRITRVHTPGQSLRVGDCTTLDQDSAHYLFTVLRLRPGSPVALFNAQDGELLGELITADRKQVSVQLLEKRASSADPGLPIHLAVGLSRGERMDFLIQKATELGVTSVTPLFTEHCEVRLDNKRTEKRLAHWQKVAVSATEQCGRCQVPDIHTPLPLSEWLQQQHQGLTLILDHRAEHAPRKGEQQPSQITLLSGPEGGLSADELSAAADAGFTPTALGPRVLRTETAPLAALSVLQYLWGDFRENPVAGLTEQQISKSGSSRV